ncbi:hypothetical protein J8J20_24930, partial [Mycobacterium tuberculosis]|nr:hypothetical protein [Mycobacterium tuberculosis]
MELFIVTYQGGVPLSRNVIDGLQPLESNKYQVEFDPGRRELVSTCEKVRPSRAAAAPARTPLYV